jgi:hypothetical protein
MAAERGVKVSYKQLWDAVRFGILPEPDSERRWQPEALDVLLASAALARTVPLLSDRAVLLSVRFPDMISEDAVREAMAKLLTGIENRQDKLRWGHEHASAIEREHVELLPPALFLAYRGVPAEYWLPANERLWGNLFGEMRGTMFAMCLPRIYRLAELLEPERKAAEEAGFAFPREELLTVLAARDISAETALLLLFAADVLQNVGKGIADLGRFLKAGWRGVRKWLKTSAGDAGTRPMPEQQHAPVKHAPSAESGSVIAENGEPDDAEALPAPSKEKRHVA